MGQSRKNLAPQLIRIRLDKITVDSISHWNVLQRKLRHTPLAIPTLSQAALALLELSQPLQVVRVVEKAENNKTSHSYQLVGGHRTYQLLAEQHPLSHAAWAVLLPETSLENRNHQSAFDAIVIKLLQRPDGNDLGLIAKTLHGDRQLRETVSQLMPVNNDLELAAALGISRSSFHRLVQNVIAAEQDECPLEDYSASVDLAIGDELDEQ